MKQDFLSLADLGPGGIEQLLDQSSLFERTRGTSDHPRPMVGKSAALLFDKASTRTRASLEIAVVELGGHPLVLTAQGSQLARGEPPADTARVLARMVEVITYRTFGTTRLVEMARASAVPVVNALTDEAHPLQLLADLYTVRAVRGKIGGLRYAWVGDGNNMARSWIEAASLLGFELTLACPPGFEPPAAEVESARRAGAKVSVVSHPEAACAGADVISTDVWASMGQEDDAARRRAAFANFAVTSKIVALAVPDVVILHCLPAHRGEEIDADVLEGPSSFVWQEAEARLHTSKAVLAWVLARA